MDPNAATPDQTREQFTNNLVQQPIPGDASGQWKSYANPLRALLTQLAQHDAMKPNLQQTFSTPAASKNRVYFMWDFVRTTIWYLYQVPPSKTMGTTGEAVMTEMEKQAFTDVLSRSVMIYSLILDEQPGALNTMVEMSYPGNAGSHPDFGENILEEARNLKHASENKA